MKLLKIKCSDWHPDDEFLAKLPTLAPFKALKASFERWCKKHKNDPDNRNANFKTGATTTTPVDLSANEFLRQKVAKLDSSILFNLGYKFAEVEQELEK